MSTAVILGLASLLLAAGCADQQQASPTGPEPAGKLVVSQNKAGGKKERPQGPGGPRGQMIALQQLRFDQPLVIERPTGKVSIQLEEVQDSRCPDGVSCIWAGEAKVTILAQDEGEAQPHRLILTLDDQNSNRGQTAKHTIQLFGVNPYPKAGQPTAREDYVVQVGVTPTPEEGQIVNH